jgi:hypothetical protein
VQNTLEGKLGAIRFDSWNAEVQWNNINECVLDTVSDLVWESREDSKETMDHRGNNQ